MNTKYRVRHSRDHFGGILWWSYFSRNPQIMTIRLSKCFPWQFSMKLGVIDTQSFSNHRFKLKTPDLPPPAAVMLKSTVISNLTFHRNICLLPHNLVFSRLLYILLFQVIFSCLKPCLLVGVTLETCLGRPVKVGSCNGKAHIRKEFGADSQKYFSVGCIFGKTNPQRK